MRFFMEGILAVYSKRGDGGVIGCPVLDGDACSRIRRQWRGPTSTVERTIKTQGHDANQEATGGIVARFRLLRHPTSRRIGLFVLM